MNRKESGWREQFAGGLKWLSLAFLVVASTAVIVGMVNLSPASGQAGQVESEVLAKQLEFILKMNSAFLGFLGIIGALLTWFFKNNLEDAKEVAGRMVREELDQRIKGLVQEEFRYWEMSARSERVVGQSFVLYYLPDAQGEPPEYSLVKNRGFRRADFCTDLAEVRRSRADVVIFDAQNWKTSVGSRVVETERGRLVEKSEAMVREQIDELRDRLGDHVVLVVYVRGIVSYLNDPQFEKLYVLPANNQVTLLGHAVNGAYVAFGDRNLSASS